MYTYHVTWYHVYHVKLDFQTQTSELYGTEHIIAWNTDYIEQKYTSIKFPEKFI